MDRSSMAISQACRRSHRQHDCVECNSILPRVARPASGRKRWSKYPSYQTTLFFRVAKRFPFADDAAYELIACKRQNWHANDQAIAPEILRGTAADPVKLRIHKKYNW